MKKFFIVVMLIQFYFYNSFSQNLKLDSVFGVIKNMNDTTQIKILLENYTKCEQGNIVNGKVFLDKAFIISQTNESSKWHGKVLLRFGNLYNITGEYEKAIDYINQSKEIFDQIDNYQGIGSAYNNLGATYEKMGRYDDAMDNLIKALSTYELNADSLSIAKTYLNLGLLYFRNKDYEKSMELYRKSLEIREKLNDIAGIALIYNNMAIVNYYTGNYDDVRNYFEKSYLAYVELGYVRQQLMALSNLAGILDILGQKGKALEKYYEILKLEEELGQKGEQAKTNLLIGDLYSSRKQYRKAQKFYFEGLRIANEIGALAELSEAYSSLSQNYKDQFNYQKALEYNEQFIAINDSIYNKEKSRQIQEIETKYETKKKEQLIINLENEKIIADLRIKKQRIILISFLGVFFSIIIFLLILFRQNKIIRGANKLLAYQKKQITDSIEYASRIQTAMLPPGDYISKIIPEHFIVYKPRDIVSGDFYWITHKEGKIVIAVVDCTGHGVPGAFMSMLGFAFLNEIVNKEKELKANIILNQLRDYVKASLHQTGKEDEAKDGMDIALCIIDPDELKMQFSGAYNPLYLIKNNEMISIKADRMPIGIHVFEKDSFTNHEMSIQKGDIIYMFTDGYIDQFGGPKTQKFRIAPFRNLLISNRDKSMKQQKEILEKNFEDWKGNHDQIDDVLVMGIKI
ncbi:MAG: tetratricopeptide repeat protein [Bacteroidales bacterium]|nr:tetratricopeptide repeat protein [Bacteroidales bacterium]